APGKRDGSGSRFVAAYSVGCAGGLGRRRRVGRPAQYVAWAATWWLGRRHTLVVARIRLSVAGVLVYLGHYSGGVRYHFKSGRRLSRSRNRSYRQRCAVAVIEECSNSTHYWPAYDFCHVAARHFLWDYRRLLQGSG